MSRTGYTVLGWVVWKGARFYLRRKVNAAPGGQKTYAAAVVAVGVGVFLLAARRRESET